MKIWIGSDHRGIEYKELINKALMRRGIEAHDAGAYQDKAVDYADIALKVSKAVGSGEVDMGVLVCSSGIGMSIGANRIKGVRAALCLTPKMAEMSRRHNNSNILCIGQDLVDRDRMLVILDTWLDTDFEGGRHERRINKLDNLC